MDRGKNNRNRFFRGRGFYFKNRGRGRGDKQPNKNDQTQNDDRSQSLNQSKITSFAVSNCPYSGWKLYHPDEGMSIDTFILYPSSVKINKLITDYNEDSPTAHKVKSIECFIKKNQQLFSLATIKETQSFCIDVRTLYNDENFKSSWKNLESDLRDYPGHTISCLGLGMHQVY